MKDLKKIFILLCALFFLFSCTHTKTPREIINENPIFHLTNYPSFNPEQPLIDRIVSAPDFVLSYLKNMDEIDSYTSYTPTKEEMAMCAEYLDKLPGLHKKVLIKRLVGIYFIENFLGSGMADFVLDEKNNVYCNLFINPGTMRHDISSWMSYRENSCYVEEQSDIGIILNCGNEYSGLMYTLLHEATHIVDYTCFVTPYVDEFLQELLNRKQSETKFTHGVWEEYKTPVNEYNFDLRSEVAFYGFGGGPKINIKEAEGLYRHCKNTPFVSLYSTANWAEDWAEVVTWYYFTSELNQPYEIGLYKGDEPISIFKPMEWEKVILRIPVVEEILAMNVNLQ